MVGLSAGMARSCGALLEELQQIWEEIGESKADKDRMLADAERECIEIYRRKVDEAGKAKAQLHQSVAAKEAEVAALVATLGEHSFHSMKDKKPASLRQQLASVISVLDNLRAKKDERTKLFSDMRSQIEKISEEIREYENQQDNATNPIIIDEHDLSTRKLDEYRAQLRALQKDKSDRLQKVLEYVSEVHSLCGVLGLDFRKTVVEVHPSLHETSPGKPTSISNTTLEGLAKAILKLKADKKIQLQKVKEESMSRRDIMDRINKWLATCEEEAWLEQYNQDGKRYNAGRGSHINLKHAEKARIAVTRIPAMVDNLISKTFAWEDDRKKPFLYDGVRLVSILEEYKLTRQQKEEEKKRFRDQKKLQALLLSEKEAMFGSKSVPKRSNSLNRKYANGNGFMTPAPRRISVGSGTPELLTPRSYSARESGYFKEPRRLSMTPLNFVALPKDDSMSTLTSISGSEPESPLLN